MCYKANVISLCFREQISEGGAGLYPLYFWSKSSFFLCRSLEAFSLDLFTAEPWGGTVVSMAPCCSTVYFLNLPQIADKSIRDSSKKSTFLSPSSPTWPVGGQLCGSFLVFETQGVHSNYRFSVQFAASMPLLLSLCWACRLKSLTLFSPLTVTTDRVSNTNSPLSCYICSGHGSEDGRKTKMLGSLFAPRCTLANILSLIVYLLGSTRVYLAL